MKRNDVASTLPLLVTSKPTIADAELSAQYTLSTIVRLPAVYTYWAKFVVPEA